MYKESYSKEISKLKNSKTALEQKIGDLINEKKEIENKLKICEKEKKELIQIEKSKNSDFKNFIFTNYFIEEKFLNKIKANCVLDYTIDICCISNMLKHQGIKLKNQIDEKIKIPEELTKSKIGDLEDWSFYLMIILNNLAEKGYIKYIRFKNNKNDEYVTKDLILTEFSVICTNQKNKTEECYIGLIDIPYPEKIQGLVINPFTCRLEGDIINKNSKPVILADSDKEIMLILTKDSIWYKYKGFWLKN
jgi:hypothetical protein